MPSSPRIEQAVVLCQDHLGVPVQSIARFPTGLCHHVYDVVLNDGRAVVVRMATAETRDLLRGGIYWSEVLRPRRLPLPELLFADPEAAPFAYMILKRLSGTDLGDVYPKLQQAQKRALAQQLVALQARVAALGPGRGFGDVYAQNGPFPHRSWQDVLQADLDRSRKWIQDVGVADDIHVQHVADLMEDHDRYLSNVEPIPFLGDITTKNVIMHNGKLSGIVDVDEICYGDPLINLALTRMALLARQWKTDYVDFWSDEIGLSKEQQKALDLYTAIHCVSFLGELGQRLNRDTEPLVLEQDVKTLLDILDTLLADQ